MAKYKLNHNLKTLKEGLKNFKKVKHMHALVNDGGVNSPLTTNAAICAALSNDVYEGFFSPRKPLPPGWIRFKDSPHYNSGYFGACHINIQTNPSQIIVAHRGTCIDIAHLRDDLKIAREIPPLQLADAINFTNEVVNEASNFVSKLKGEDQDISLIFTGHSAGALISDVAALMAGAKNSLKMFDGAGIPSVTFENPGSKNTIRYLLAQTTADNQPLDAKTRNLLMQMMSANCVTFDADVNMINTCNEQLGSVQRLTNLPYHYHSILTGNFELATMFNEVPYKNPVYLQYTFQQHSMENICNYLKNNGSIATVNQPFGFKQGFGAYLDYLSRKKYWDGLLEKLWNQDDTYKVRDLYENDKSAFMKASIKNLKICHDNVLSRQIKTASVRTIFSKKKETSNSNKFIRSDTKDQQENLSIKFNLFRSNDTTKSKDSRTNGEHTHIHSSNIFKIFNTNKNKFSHHKKEIEQIFKTVQKAR